MDRDKIISNFTRAIKIFNSEWECGIPSECSDGKGNIFLRLHIKDNGYKPDKDTCLAVANYLSIIYNKKVKEFFVKIN